ncbi:MAG: ABC transporter substrate-binding protein [Armatimonadota bacterium]|nr:ABC transporter substrate-binding protein [Armatimonadota bacterium]MDR7440264.1 ABC transporter substrate-binding protein [Armatimonadota bacterium]MDR7443839.1 ABC transporter substrate-binding protein [Armatimonadota bacterium]MDR7568992.1 ABC transporter substrate-binding protein [Armatimonadota bacterium]MDR7613881.1 ABC transporter substrate-binding protein [Armatimonadota bacterium]
MRFVGPRWMLLFGALCVVFGVAPVGMGQVREIVVGVVVDITGPASSLGVPERNTVQLYESDFGGVQGRGGAVRIRWVVTDGETDVTRTVVAVRRLIEEERAAAIICCTTSPGNPGHLEHRDERRDPDHLPRLSPGHRGACGSALLGL